MTQEEMLEEARETEVKNLESLKLLLMWEEEKKKNRMRVRVDCGPMIRYVSNVNGDFITFPEGYDI